MTLTIGDPVLNASPTDDINTGSGALDLSTVGFPNPSFATGGGGSGVSNQGGAINGNPLSLREIRPGVSDLFGKSVQLTGKSVAMRGAVILALQLELSDTGGAGALSDCVLVQAEGFRFLALVADVTEVDG